MDYFTYKVLHLTGLILMFASFGLILVALAVGDVGNRMRKLGFVLHGISWLTVFVTAFGLVNTLGMHTNFPNWARAKTAIWVLLGVGAWVCRKKVQWTYANLFVVSALGVTAIWLAVVKPMF